MQIGRYLRSELILFLQARTKRDALEEMVGVLCRQRPETDADVVLRELERRESILSSRIAARIALPHVLLPGFGAPIIVLGYSEDGIPWDSPGGEGVNLIVLGLCGEEYGKEHIDMIAAVANSLHDPAVLDRMAATGTPEQLYELLTALPRTPTGPMDAGTVAICRLMLQHAEAMAQEADARAVMVVAGADLDPGILADRRGKVPLVLITDESGETDAAAASADHLLQVPGHGLERAQRVKLALLYALSYGIIDSSDTVVVLSGAARARTINALEVVEVGREFELLVSFRSEMERGDFSPHVFHRVLQIAVALAREGREGTPVGAIFVLGDYQNVRRRCYQLVINPFRGYPESERNVLDPALEETIKEFSRVDGACLIRGDGVIMSLGAYIQAEDAAQALPSGLGARHAAAMAISMSTQAVSIVISQSTRRISIFQQGHMVVALDPEQH